MGTCESPRSLPEAASALFGQYGVLSVEQRREALTVFSTTNQPYWDADRDRWVVGTFDQTRRVLIDPDLGNDLNSADSQTNSHRLQLRMGPVSPSLLFLDPPEHWYLRKILGREFGRSRCYAAAQNLSIQWAAEFNRAKSSKESTYLGATVVHPACLRSVVEVLGIPMPHPSDVPRVIEDLFLINQMFDLKASNETLVEAYKAYERIRQLIEPSRSLYDVPQDVSCLDDYLQSTLIFMLRAAIVTVGSLILALLTSNIEANSIDEAIVSFSPTSDTGRVTQNNVIIGGVSLPPRQTVIALIAAANIDLTANRIPIHKHLSFGAGIHRCLGEGLVRALVGQALEIRKSLSAPLMPEQIIFHRTQSVHGFRDILVRI